MSKKRKALTKRTKKDSKRRSQPATASSRPPQQNVRELLGFMAGQIEIVGDIESPIEDWKH